MHNATEEGNAMTTWGWNVIEFGIDFFEMLITCYLAYHLFSSQKERSSPARIKLFIFSLSGTIIQFVSEQGLLPIPDLFPVVLTFLLYAVIVCRAKIIQAFLWSLVNCLVLGITTISLSSLISLFLHTAVENLFSYSGYRIMFLVINKIAQLSITELIIRIAKHGKLQTSQRGGNALILFSLFSIFSLLLLWKIEYIQTPNIILFFNLFICMLLLCMNFSLMFFLSFVKKASEEKFRRTE
ncbi:MAG: hypothetical protein Q4G52_08420 [Clostridia bacterium]|nr:hypothetical protein [Clostridia bacterium]